ncbi:MAG: hypothetical protein ACOY3P_20425, partial [Planctomycetota bacterium]
GRPWDTTSDLTIRYNRIINSVNGVSIARFSSAGPVEPGAEPTSRILMEHNLFERFGEASDFGRSGQPGILFQVSGRDLTFRHNTAWCGHGMLSLTKPGVDNFVFLDNLATPGSYVLHADGAAGGWNGGLGTHIRGQSRMTGNVIVRVGSDRARKTSPQACPPGNTWFDSFEAAGVDPVTYRLLPGSKAKGAGSGGADPGADVDAVLRATQGVRADVP